MFDDLNIITRLSKEARVLMVARMLPAKGAITESLREAVREAFVAHCDHNSITYNQVAREIRYSLAVVSQWANGKYEGDNDTTTRVINNWLENDARTRWVEQDVPYVRTTIVEEVRATVMAAQQTRKMAVIVAPSGTGKTMLIKELVDQTRGYYLACGEKLTARKLLLLLADVVKAKHDNTAGGAMLGIVAEIKGRKTPIFLDEFQQSPKDILGSLRYIFDESGCSVIMVGTHKIQQITNDRALGCGQFARRCYVYNALEQIHNAETSKDGEKLGRALYTREEIAEYIALLGIRLDKGALEMCWGIACLPNHGCLGTIKGIFDPIRLAGLNDRVLTRKDIYDGLTMQIGMTGKHIFTCAERHVAQFKRAIA